MDFIGLEAAGIEDPPLAFSSESLENEAKAKGRKARFLRIKKPPI
ncbi:MAG: hypothetical protein PUE59_01040 [Treponema sp.]|nr:hypothetical protein [Treponema sp.]MDD6653586.1 hypothetical protein [Treponema sp.]